MLQYNDQTTPPPPPGVSQVTFTLNFIWSPLKGLQHFKKEKNPVVAWHVLILTFFMASNFFLATKLPLKSVNISSRSIYFRLRTLQTSSTSLVICKQTAVIRFLACETSLVAQSTVLTSMLIPVI